MNGMVAQIHSIPDLIGEVVQPYHESIRSTLDRSICQTVQRIYLTGCGDSHHASLGAELAFESLAGVPTEALTALQYSRYVAEYMPGSGDGTNWVIGTSVSGEVSRLLEALLCGRKVGALALALTASPGSRVAQAADFVIDTTQPPFHNPPGLEIPGVRSYVANQIALLLAAIHLGEMRGRLSAEKLLLCVKRSPR
jgi:glutamine---fructose-6-phosphate transaminase (isomerizing)